MLNLNFQRHDWHDDAACRNHPDPELWFYESKRYEDEQKLQEYRIVEALEICSECPVSNLCLKQGLENENLVPGSIWGGMVYSERVVISGKSRPAHVRSEQNMLRRVRNLRRKLSL